MQMFFETLQLRSICVIPEIASERKTNRNIGVETLELPEILAAYPALFICKFAANCHLEAFENYRFEFIVYNLFPFSGTRCAVCYRSASAEGINQNIGRRKNFNDLFGNCFFAAFVWHSVFLQYQPCTIPSAREISRADAVFVAKCYINAQK